MCNPIGFGVMAFSGYMSVLCVLCELLYSGWTYCVDFAIFCMRRLEMGLCGNGCGFNFD